MQEKGTPLLSRRLSALHSHALIPEEVISLNSSFLVASLGFSKYLIILSTNSKSVTSSFLISIHLISSSFLIALVNTSSTMVSGSTVDGHSCLI